MKHNLAVAVLVGVGFLGGCITTRPSNLTPGMAKKHIEPGVTHQAKVIEVFGPPNIITRRDGGEMWVYDKVSRRQTRAAFGMGAAGGAAGGSGAGAGLLGGGAGSTTHSETTVMLIVYYDERDVVRDYQITQTKF